MRNSWTVERSKKAAATRLARDPEAFKKMGQVGGSRPKPKKIDDMPIAEQYEPLKSEPKQHS